LGVGATLFSVRWHSEPPRSRLLFLPLPKPGSYF
jgi:hypothetical protein